MESGQLVLARQDFQLKDVLQRLDTMSTRSCASKGLDLGLHIDPDVPLSLLGYAPRQTQAWMSLVGNVIKFTDQGQVHVRVQRKDMDKFFVRLQFTADDTGRERAGQGSSSWFTVSLQLPASALQVVPADTTSKAQSLAGVRVWVVDANSSIRDIVCQLLQLAQVEVDVAENGLQALDKIRQNSYDVVLMDLQMPVMGGLKATRQIRQDLAFADLPIVALTARGFKSDWAQRRAQGMTDWLEKPL